jgi:hypothetical protein
LQEFAVQQVGNRLQFTDRDGSIYFADVTASPQGTPLVAVPAPVLTQNQPAGLRGQPGRSQPQPVPAPGRSQATGNALFFNAVGTNRTLQQRVTFDGSLVFTNSHMPPPSLEVVLTNDAAFGIWLDNSRVEGEAIVGDRTRVQIEALPER